MAEYSYPLVQTVANEENVLFTNGNKCCKRGLIVHNDSSGVFRLKGAVNSCRTIYKVTFDANVAISTGSTVEAISLALTQNGEVLRNGVATITPAAVGDFWSVSVSALVELPCGCCDTLTVQNISPTASVDVINSNIIIERIA